MSLNLLQEAMLRAFQIVDLAIFSAYKAFEEPGFAWSSVVEKGPHGPQLRASIGDVTLRLWVTENGPGCKVTGANVIGFVWARFNFEVSDRPIGIVIHGSALEWRALKSGDLPGFGHIKVGTESIRSGVERVADLIRDPMTPRVLANYSERMKREAGGVA